MKFSAFNLAVGVLLAFAIAAVALYSWPAVVLVGFGLVYFLSREILDRFKPKPQALPNAAEMLDIINDVDTKLRTEINATRTQLAMTRTVPGMRS